MLVFYAYEYYNYALKQLEDLNASIQPMLDFAEKYNEVVLNGMQIIFGTAKVTSSSGEYHYIVHDGSLIDKFKSAISQFKQSFHFLPAFSKYGLIKNNLQKYTKEHEIDDSELSSFFDIVDNNFSLYEAYLQSQDDRKKAVIFGQNNIAFKASFESLLNSYHNTLNMLTENYPLDDSAEGEKLIDIRLLHTNYSFEQFVSLLTSINKLYCIIGNQSFKSGYEKLEVVKIESGSLLAILQGHPEIISFLTFALFKTADIMYRKFTVNGKLLQHHDFMKQLKEDVEFGKKLSDLGYDIDSSEENIESSYCLLTKELYNIVSSSGTLVLNKEELTIGAYQEQKYLEASKRLLESEEQEKK